MIRRKASEGPHNQRTSSSQNGLQSPDNRRKDLITQKQISKLLSPQKPQIPAVNLYKGDQHKHLHREVSPARNIIQKTDPGYERDVDSVNQTSKKPTRVLTGLSSLSKPKLFNGETPLILHEKKEIKNIKQVKKNGSWSKNLSLKDSKPTKSETPQNLTPKWSENHMSPNSPLEDFSQAIHEREDEVDEEDNRNWYRYTPQGTEPNKEIHISPRDLLSPDLMRLSTQIAPQSQMGDESPRQTQETEGNARKNRFRPTSLLTGGDMNTSGLNMMTEGNTSTLKSPGHIRGAFMNEHISQSEFEKQKEKQKQMKEFLDSQLNEKKRKQEEEKLKEREINKREEERIRREMVQMKSKYDREVAMESSKKTPVKQENNENYALQVQSKLAGPQVSKQESISVEVKKPETKEYQSKLLSKSSSKITEKRFFDFSEELEKPTLETESKEENGINMLVDENKKLRDENTKKEELIDVLLNALKQKSLSSPKASTSKLPNNFSKESNASYTKPPKPNLEKLETDADFYGYYLNQYSSGYKTRTEQKDVSMSGNDDKNYSVNGFDSIESKGLKPKINKPIPETLLETLKISTPQGSFYRPQVGPNVHNNDSINPMGSTASRVFSSPLTSHLNKYSIGNKLESKGMPYLPYTPSNLHLLTPNAMSLESFKLPTQTSSNGAKSNILIHKEFIHYNDNSMGRLKKRYEHSVDFTDTKKDKEKPDYKPLTTYRPIINILRDDGSFIKPNQYNKKELTETDQPYNPVNNGLYESKTMKANDAHISIMDTAATKNFTPKPSAPNFFENNLRIVGKINSSDNAYEKKPSNDFGKNMWIYAEKKRPSKEELFDKIKMLPKLETKSKFPKEVFSLSMKKRACP